MSLCGSPIQTEEDIQAILRSGFPYSHLLSDEGVSILDMSEHTPCFVCMPEREERAAYILEHMDFPSFRPSPYFMAFLQVVYETAHKPTCYYRSSDGRGKPPLR